MMEKNIIHLTLFDKQFVKQLLKKDQHFLKQSKKLRENAMNLQEI